MNILNNYIAEYLEYCEYRKRLDSKTLKAYKIDLKQYENFCTDLPDGFSKSVVDNYITSLHKQYKPKTVKRKIACLKAFFHHMEYRECWAIVLSAPRKFILMCQIQSRRIFFRINTLGI